MHSEGKDRAMAQARRARGSHSFQNTKEVILGPQLFSAFSALLAQAHFLKILLGGVRISKKWENHGS